MAADVEGTKTRLLVEARDLYLEVGLAHFSLREVARRVGVSAAAVYRHFASKEALIAEICAAGFRQFGSYLLRALGEPTPRTRLVRATELYLEFALEHPRDYRVIFMGDADSLSPLKDSKIAHNGAPDPTFQFLVDRVRECMQTKVIKKRDEREVAAIVWAHVHGLASLRIAGHLSDAGDDAAFARFYGHSVSHLLVGLAA